MFRGWRRCLRDVNELQTVLPQTSSGILLCEEFKESETEEMRERRIANLENNFLTLRSCRYQRFPLIDLMMSVMAISQKINAAAQACSLRPVQCSVWVHYRRRRTDNMLLG